jgi:hypothetical protein
MPPVRAKSAFRGEAAPLKCFFGPRSDNQLDRQLLIVAGRCDTADTRAAFAGIFEPPTGPFVTLRRDDITNPRH